MRIRLLTPIAGTPSHEHGAVLDVPEDVARAWVAQHIAEPAGDDVETAMVATPVETAVRGRRQR